MTLLNEIENIFKENQDRITLSLVMELVDDILDSTLEFMAKSEAEAAILKEQVRNKLQVQIKQNLERKRAN